MGLFSYLLLCLALTFQNTSPPACISCSGSFQTFAAAFLPVSPRIHPSLPSKPLSSQTVLPASSEMSSSSSAATNNHIRAGEVQICSASDPTLAQRLTQLASNTEMKSYGVEQWQFLLDAGDVTPLVVANRDTSDDIMLLLGCVLRIQYGLHSAYGMMLVSPETRGQGLARKLLERAMALPGDLKILGTCTELGRPFYEKVGYKRVASVTRMTIPLNEMSSTMGDSPRSIQNGDYTIRIDNDGHPSMAKVLELDAIATGLDRSATLQAIQMYPYVSTATIADADGTIQIAALITKHTGSDICTVGPILGKEEFLLPLLHGIRNEYAGTTKEMALIVSDHANVVETLKSAGFNIAFELGAMTMDGVPMPGKRDLYLGLIHPTLG